jgi:YtkA-like
VVTRVADMKGSGAGRRFVQRARRAAVLSLVATATLRCGGEPNPCAPAATFPAAAALAIAGDSRKVELTVRTSPQPLARGLNTAQYTVADAAGAPLSGLEIAVVPWMIDMGHGSSIQPQVAEEEAPGVYLVSCLDLMMPGTWQLRTTFSGPVSDSATPTFQVP